ncbi:MAG TPA: hypothetical protein VNY31_02030 [Solirubrobacteraceae bacterium]|nr:hypothetical protein [Solirubrobacteraceae bacterium]
MSTVATRAAFAFIAASAVVMAAPVAGEAGVMVAPAAPVAGGAGVMLARRTVLVEGGAMTVITSGANVAAAKLPQRRAGADGEESNREKRREA